MSQQYSNWCFTLNNYTSADEETFLNLDAKYLVYGREVGAEGTPHLQGYIQFNKKKRLTALKKLQRSAHWEPAEGTQEHNYAYCTKDGDFVEQGIPTKTKGGAPTALERIARNQRLRDTPNLNDLINDGTLTLNQVPCIEKARKILKEHERSALALTALDGDLPHLWYWGPSGTGKSLKARTDHPDAYLKAANKWWDGYNGEHAVIIEDFDKKHEVLCHHLKLWADRYPFNGEIKGGSTGKIRPGLIIVTSNYHPRDIWTDPCDLEPILRRFNVVEFDNFYQQQKEKKRKRQDLTLAKEAPCRQAGQDCECGSTLQAPHLGTALSVEGKPGSRLTPLDEILSENYHPSFNYGQ